MLETWVLRFFLVGVRIGGLMTFAPFFGNASIPTLVKVGLTVFVTYLLIPVYANLPALPAHPAALAAVVLSEAAVGLLLGFCVQFVIEGMILAGQFVSFQFGFSLENIIDPNTQVEITVVATLYELIGLLIFLELGAHRWLLRVMALSFRILPPGAVISGQLPAKDFLKAGTALWAIGAEMAFPILVVTMLTDFTVGFLTKASPQFPALFFGISAKTLLGMALLAATVAFWPPLLEHDFLHALRVIESLLSLARTPG